MRPDPAVDLWAPLALTPELTLRNRIVMAPMTRCFADEHLVPTKEAAAYYARRADAGLLISEATIVAAEGQGISRTPGLFTDAHEAGWARVTAAVHARGAPMFCQLWHTGRTAHSSYTGTQPIGPSAVRLDGFLPGRRAIRYEMPRAMEAEDFERTGAAFAAAARRAEAAGFDGIEIHGANGYLLDQFLRHETNQRTDEYGGEPARMVRFPLEVLDAVLAATTLSVGMRLAPAAHVNVQADPRDRAVYELYLLELSRRRLSYVHLGAATDQLESPELGERPGDFLRRHYPGKLILTGGYDRASAGARLAGGEAELIAFGRPFLANPDLVERLRSGAPLATYDRSLLSQLF